MNLRDLYNKFDGHCAYCGKKIEFDDMTIDHVVPSSKGGKTVEGNIVPACHLCNGQKANKSVEECREHRDMDGCDQWGIAAVKNTISYGDIYGGGIDVRCEHATKICIY